MFIPLHDANKLKHIDLQYVTLGLIAANALVFVFVNLSLPGAAGEAAVISFGYIPGVVNDLLVLPPGYEIIPGELSLVSYSFLHQDLLHLGTNMLFLWVFGDNVEDAMGHLRYLAFYLLCAAAGALAHGLIDPASDVPLIGASGAVSGIIGAYLVLHPKVRVWILAFGRIPLRLPAAIPLVVWIGYQLLALAIYPEDTVSFAAHVGGVAAGAVLILVMRRRGVPLFDREIVEPRSVVLEGEAKTSRPSGPPGPWGRA